jgi:hypothetical protein
MAKLFGNCVTEMGFLETIRLFFGIPRHPDETPEQNTPPNHDGVF